MPSGALPSVVAPSVKVTTPVSATTAGATMATLAVKSTRWPTSEGLGALASVVVEPARLTCCTSIAVLVMEPRPAKVAVTVYVPALANGAVIVAVPLTVWALPRMVTAPFASVAVMVTCR